MLGYHKLNMSHAMIWLAEKMGKKPDFNLSQSLVCKP